MKGKNRRILFTALSIVSAAFLGACSNAKVSESTDDKPVYYETLSDDTSGVQESLSSVTRLEETASSPEGPAAGNDAVVIIEELPDYPEYSGEPYAVINDNVPTFTDSDYEKASSAFEYYSKLDGLGRCGLAEASVGIDTMPTGERGNIGSVKPSGWDQGKYRGVGKEGEYDLSQTNFYQNRGHLIGWQLTAENANERNLITSTRYMNVIGVEPFENETADYIRSTNDRVLYMAEPIFYGNELMARGVHMMAASVSDHGKGFSFNVYTFNVQPGIHINYTDGSSYSENGDPNLYTGKQ